MDPDDAVRRAEPADLAALPAVEAAADTLFLPLGITGLPAPATPEERAAAWRVLVAGRPPRGFAVLERVDGDVHLEQLSVHPGAMRRGLGAALLAGTVEEARAAGAGRVTLTTYADVPWNAPWYARHGFAETRDVGPGLAAVVRAELAAGLDRHGRRVVMARPVR
ncbi:MULTISPECIES: GNAT family N-acetyltransferase [unclassified Blastococcus]